MHSCTQRLVEITSVTLSAYLTGLLIVVASSFIPNWQHGHTPIISEFNMSLSPLMQLPLPALYAQGEHPPPMQDVIFVVVNMRVDFSSVWDWNTKGIYVALIAHYTNNQDVVSEATIIDAVLKSRKEAKEWRLDNVQKYPLEDEHLGALAGVRVQVTLRYQVLRYCGYSPVFDISPTKEENVLFKLPSTYRSTSNLGR